MATGLSFQIWSLLEKPNYALLKKVPLTAGSCICSVLYSPDEQHILLVDAGTGLVKVHLVIVCLRVEIATPAIARLHNSCRMCCN